MANNGVVNFIQGVLNASGVFTPQGTNDVSIKAPLPVAIYDRPQNASSALIDGFLDMPVANTTYTLFSLDVSRQGALLWNYSASPIYIRPGIGATPPPVYGVSMQVPPAVNGIPGQFLFDFAPIGIWGARSPIINSLNYWVY